MLTNSIDHESPYLKANDLFRAGIKLIIKGNNIKQKEIAMKLNNLHASEKTAATDLSDFLHDRKIYSLEKQERLAHILGYSYLDILKYGETLLDDKVKDFKKEKTLRKIISKSGQTYSIATILKMMEEFLLSHYESLQLEKSLMIEDIIKKWKTLKIAQKLGRKLF